MYFFEELNWKNWKNKNKKKSVDFGYKHLVYAVTNLNFYQYYQSIIMETITLENVDKLDARWPKIVYTNAGIYLLLLDRGSSIKWK